MLSFRDHGARLCDNLSRREWLRAGSLGAFGLSLPSLLSARGHAAPAGAPDSFGKAKACIVLFHLGGPPQHETWDMKPDAPVGIRGEFNPIATNVTGIRVCELMPRTARHLDKICVLRAMSTMDSAHSSSGYWMLTGVPHVPTNAEGSKPGAPNDWPCLAAIMQKLHRSRNGLPASIVLPEHIWNNGTGAWPGQDGGFLGRTANPWLIHCDPSRKAFQVEGLALPVELSADRLGERKALLAHLDRAQRSLEGTSTIATHDSRTRQAFDLLSAGKARAAFEMEREPATLRERYGMNRWGQSVLLARRLVEAGVSLVQVNWTRMEGDTTDSPAWDTHGKNAFRLKNNLMPKMDLAYSALLEDLEARGLLESTLVVWMGEFGRTPKINGGGGRDHWGPVFSATLAGGGIRGGQVLGASDKIGAYPRDGRVSPQDLAATVYHCLGHPSHTEVHDTQGRPHAITRGTVIRQAV
jgi:hypothetical protein